MATTIYATFGDLGNAERAAGALLDYGVRSEDLSLVRKGEQRTISSSPPVSNASYGEEPVHGADRFGADALGVTDLPTSDANGIAAEHEIRRGLDVDPDAYASGSSASSTDYYDNLTAYDRDAADVDHDPEDAAKSGITPTTGADAGAGAVKGAGMGLGFGAIAALASIFVPGFGLITGGGALATALAGLAGTTGAGAIAGGATGYLKDQGMDSHAVARYDAALSGGGALLSVAVPSGNVDEATVRSILDKYGAANVTNFASTGSGGYVA